MSQRVIVREGIICPRGMFYTAYSHESRLGGRRIMAGRPLRNHAESSLLVFWPVRPLVVQSATGVIAIAALLFSVFVACSSDCRSKESAAPSECFFSTQFPRFSVERSDAHPAELVSK